MADEDRGDFPTPPRVSVVIPMYNAEAFVDQTLRSVRAQTVRDIEIFVIDDGSQDAGPSIVARHADADHRITLIRQENAGVAAARNRGAAEAGGLFIAFIDADDLWTEKKLENQLARFAQGPTTLGLVYSWFARLDADGIITAYGSASDHEGDVLPAMCLGNIVGNGSSILVRRDLFEASGGFDIQFQRDKIQGCEDYDLYARIAGECDFGLVRSFDVGYRITDNNMSSDITRMVRARNACARRLIARHPNQARLVRYGQRRFMRWSLRRGLVRRQYRTVAAILLEMLANDPIGNVFDFPKVIRHRATIARLAKQEDAAGGTRRFKIGELQTISPFGDVRVGTAERMPRA